MKKIILLFTIVLFASKTKAQCNSSNSPTFQIAVSQATLATNGFCTTQVSIVNANTNPAPGGSLTYGFIAPNGAPSPTINPNVGGTWTIIVTALSNGCSTTETVQVNVLPAPSVSVTTYQPTLSTNGFCATQVFSGGAVSYTYFAPNGNIILPAPLPPIAGIWTVTGTGMNGCSTSQTFQINVFDAPLISVTASNTLVCLGNASTLTASGANTYTWNNNTTGNQFTTSAFTTTGNVTYSVQLQGTSNEGCVGTNTAVSVNINVQDCSTSTVGIWEVKNEDLEVKIFPNPAQDKITLTGNKPNEEVSISIVDVTGRAVINKKAEIKNHAADVELNLANGAYLIIISNSKHESFTKKLLIAK